MNTSFFEFIHQDILQSLLYEWLDIQDICQLDIACCNHQQRNFYTHVLQSPSLPLIQSLVLEKTQLPQLIQWSKTRGIQHPIKKINFTQKDDTLKSYSYGLEELNLLESLFMTLLHPQEIDTLFSLTNLKSLCLNCDYLDHTSAIQFQRLFQNLSHLDSLRLSGCEFITAISSSFNQLSSLTELELVNCRLSKDCLEDISRLSQLESLILVEVLAMELDYQVLSALTNLIKLDLSYTNVNNQGFHGFLKLNQLKELKLECDEINFADDSFEELLSFIHLERLILLGMNIDNRFLQYIFQCKNLTSLCISEFENLSPELFSQLSHLSKLEKLELYNNNLDEVGFEALCKLSQLTYLDLNGSNDISSIVENISQLQKLEYLNLSDCFGVDDKLLQEISKILSITSLDLESCDGITLQGLQSLSQLIHLKYLNIKYSDIQCEKHEILELLQIPNLILYFI